MPPAAAAAAAVAELDLERLVATMQEVADRVADMLYDITILKDRVEELEDRVSHLTLPGALPNSPRRADDADDDADP